MSISLNLIRFFFFSSPPNQFHSSIVVDGQCGFCRGANHRTRIRVEYKKQTTHKRSTRYCMHNADRTPSSHEVFSNLNSPFELPPCDPRGGLGPRPKRTGAGNYFTRVFSFNNTNNFNCNNSLLGCVSIGSVHRNTSQSNV